MTYAIRIHKVGAPDVMQTEEISLPSPGPEELLIRQTAVGLNFIDVYHRTGLYPLELPGVIGMEAAGIVERIGDGPSEFKEGDRVAYAAAPPGAYTEKRIISSNRVVKILEGISEEVAAAAMLKGMTAEYLLERTFPVRAGQTILFHAAAGGVGLIACQWAKALGCTVIGTVGNTEKAELAKQNGCDHTILYREENVAERVMEITGGAGVPVVYDSVGRDTFEASLACLSTRGMLVSFGQSSGPVEEFDPKVLAPKSLFYTRPSLFNYTKSRGDLTSSANRLWEMLAKGNVKVQVRNRYALKEVANAHRDLEARKLIGSTVLIP